MYLRWDIRVPEFVRNRGDNIAFDFYGISGKNWRFFVNGEFVSRGNGGSDLPFISFPAPDAANAPMTIGFEIDVGRTLAPGIVHIGQLFLSQPEAAVKFRLAYRGLDRAAVLPTALGFALMATLAGLGCFFTPFYREILVFSIYVTTFNWRLLIANDMVPFPTTLKVDFVTLDAMLRSLLLASMWAFWALYFRVKSRLQWLPVAMYGTLSFFWFAASRGGVGLELLTKYIITIDIHQGVVFAAASFYSFESWKKTRQLPWARFRSVTSMGICIATSMISASYLARFAINFGGITWEVYREYEALYFFANYAVRAFILGFGLLIAMEWALIVRDRQSVLQRFGTIVDPRLMQDILRRVEGTSERKEGVIALFVDLRSFTKICDVYPPEQVTRTLNSYLDIVTRSVQSRDGIVDKFVGDAVMATWGVPQPGDNDPINAIRAAVNIRIAIHALNEQRTANGEFPIQVGIGIHTGSAIFGPIGNGARVDHTIIGPMVNVASRVQDLTKFYSCDILISRELYDQVKDYCLVDNLGLTEIRGMSRQVELFKVIGTYLNDDEFVIGDSILEKGISVKMPGVISNTPPNLILFDHDNRSNVNAVVAPSSSDKAA